jgi:hypothetical protein
MFRRSLQSLTVVLVAALLLNAECYATCGVSACIASNPDRSQCHHHSGKSNGSGQGCRYQHSEFFGPQVNTDIAKFAALHLPGALALPCTVSLPASGIQPAVEIVNRSEHNEHLGISVLALLSTFRI